jgi:hypothetical protein
MIIIYHRSRGNLAHLTGSIQLTFIYYHLLLITSPAIAYTVYPLLAISSRDPHKFSIVLALSSLVQPLR